MKILKYCKIVFETKIGQIRLPERSNQLQASIGFPVRVRAYSRSENPDPIHNNRSNHNPKKHTGRKLKQYGQKNLGHISGYISWERGATIYPPSKKFRPRNFDKERDEHRNKELIR